MQYSLLKEITQDDIDFVYNLKIEFAFTQYPCTIGENAYSRVEVIGLDRVFSKVDEFILKNPTPQQLSLLRLKYSDSLVSINQYLNQD